MIFDDEWPKLQILKTTRIRREKILSMKWTPCFEPKSPGSKVNVLLLVLGGSSEPEMRQLLRPDFNLVNNYRSQRVKPELIILRSFK
jgi:hypothetical protein